MPLSHRSNNDSQMTESVIDDVEDFPQKAPKGRVAPQYMGTLADQRDMSALGRVQVLRVCLPLADCDC